MKKIIPIFMCLFFNSLFSSSYDEAMKRIQCFRSLNPKTQSVLRGHAAGHIAETFENNYLDTVETKKSLPEQTETQAFTKKTQTKNMSSQEGVSDVKDLTQKVKTAFGVIVKKNMTWSDSILAIEKSKAYKDLVARYPVVQKTEYKNMLDSILFVQYQSYYLSLLKKDNK